MKNRADFNAMIVHCHDLGRHLGVYGYAGVSSPRLDRLAAQGILFTRAHATAPLCSPSRGSLFTGRYPHRNGLVGLAHHGWEYRPGVRTLSHVLSESGWYSALFGMQHETLFPERLGFDQFDVSNSHCEYVVDKATEWLRARTASGSPQPFLITAGFFEAHRPWAQYPPAALADAEVPDYLPDTVDVRHDVAGFYGAIAVADAAVGRLLDTLTETGLDASTWVVFLTDHGPAFPRAKSTLYDAGTGITMIIRPPTAGGIGEEVAPRVYDELVSGVDLVPTLLELLGIDVPADVDGVSHAANLLSPAADTGIVRDEVFTMKTYHDSFDPIRAIRTKEYSYIENFANRPALDLPWDIAESPCGPVVAALAARARPQRELYDLVADPSETHNLLSDDGEEATERVKAIAGDLAARLTHWRERTGDVIPSEFAGSQISERATEMYRRINGPPAGNAAHRRLNRRSLEDRYRAEAQKVGAAAMNTVLSNIDVHHVDELRLLEAEAVHIIREVVAELTRPVLLFSAGKDSVVLLRLAEKAFRPSPLPFPVLHVDTGHNFAEVIEFRDRRVVGRDHKLIVASVQESIDSGRVADPGPGVSRNRLQTRTLLDALEAGGFDAAFGGARRDEERARAKERILSFRDEFGQWHPRQQRPEPWSLYNGRMRKGEQVRVFPLSNWTELDIWRYIELENLELPSIYFAHQREVFERDGILLAVSEYAKPQGSETSAVEWVRYRTVGDLTITGAVRSTAADIASVIAEIAAATVSERGETRADDRTSVAAMEDRKREGYF